MAKIIVVVRADMVLDVRDSFLSAGNRRAVLRRYDVNPEDEDQWILACALFREWKGFFVFSVLVPPSSRRLVPRVRMEVIERPAPRALDFQDM